MDIEKKVIKIGDKEYAFLKPYPITLVNVEKQSLVNGEISIDRYEDGLLRLVSKDIKKENLVKFVGVKVVLENGKELTPNQIPYSQYVKLLNNFEKDDAEKIVKNFLMICNSSEIKPEELTTDDIYVIFDSYSSLYDRTELDRVLSEIASFR